MSGLGEIIINTAKSGIKNTHIVTRRVAGRTVNRNIRTGTEFVRFADGTKSVTLGRGNKLSEILGVGTNICSYPKGSSLGGAEGLTVVRGKGAKGALPMTHKAFGEFIKMLSALFKLNG